MLAVFPLRGASLPPSPHERAVWHFARRKAMASASSRQILVGCGGLSVEVEHPESTKRLARELGVGTQELSMTVMPWMYCSSSSLCSRARFEFAKYFRQRGAR